MYAEQQAEGTIARVSMFGGFRLEVHDSVISDSMNRSNKLWNLLSYFILHRNRPIPQMDLVEMLWPEEDRTNPISALKTLLSRTRGMLAPIVGGNTHFILSQRGSYSWNPDIICQLDVEEFESLCQQVESLPLSTENTLDLCRRAFSLYQGGFLPKLSSELWVIPLAAHYHTCYLQLVSRYARRLMEKQEYAELEEIAQKALQMEPLDEHTHCMLIYAYLRQGNINAALLQYKAATDLLYRSLGVHPSTNLRALYLEIMKEHKNLEVDLNIIQKDLQEKDRKPGAFVCEYGFFVEAYRLEVRRALRNGCCMHLGLLTLSLTDGEVPPLDILNTLMIKFLNVIKANLRKGDIVSQYSGSQYVLMLPTATFEDSERIMERMVRDFGQKHRYPYVDLSYKVQPMNVNGEI